MTSTAVCMLEIDAYHEIACDMYVKSRWLGWICSAQSESESKIRALSAEYGACSASVPRDFISFTTCLISSKPGLFDRSCAKIPCQYSSAPKSAVSQRK